jgi:hypothetical protein
MSPLPFVIAFILGARLEESARQAFDATGGQPVLPVSSPLARHLHGAGGIGGRPFLEITAKETDMTAPTSF